RVAHPLVRGRQPAGRGLVADVQLGEGRFVAAAGLFEQLSIGERGDRHGALVVRASLAQPEGASPGEPPLSVVTRKMSGWRRHTPPPRPSLPGMKETWEQPGSPHPSLDGSTRLLSLVDRSGPPPRPVGGLLQDWYLASGTSLPFAEWADPATDQLAGAFARGADLVEVEQAVVAFAEARAGAEHPAEAVAADLVALVRLAWPT